MFNANIEVISLHVEKNWYIITPVTDKEGEMSELKKRKKYIIVNKYQRLILVPALATNMISLLVVILLLNFIVFDFFTGGALKLELFTAEQMRIVAPLTFVIVVYCNVVLFIWSHKVTHKFAGPLERINREINEIADGTKKEKKIVLRKDDYLTDLVNAINRVLERLP